MIQTTNQPWIIMERKFEPFLYDTMIWHWTDIGSVSKCFVCGIRANLKAVISHLCPVLKRQVRRLPQWHLKAAMHRDASAPIPQIAQSRWFCTICVVGWPYSWKPERAWKPEDNGKKTRTDCQLLSKPTKLTADLLHIVLSQNVRTLLSLGDVWSEI